MYVCVHYMQGTIYVLPRGCYVFVCMCPAWRVVYTVVSHKYAPAFRNLSLSTKCRVGGGGGGRLYAGCDNFSRDYALPSGHEVIVGGGWRPSVGRRPSMGHRRARGGEMLTTLTEGNALYNLHASVNIFGCYSLQSVIAHSFRP